MSIQDELAKLVAAGRLFPLALSLPSDQSVRRIFLSQEIQQLLVGPWVSVEWEKRCYALRATLESFVRGERVTVSLVPYEHGEADMGRLDTPKDNEVWDIRDRKTKPGLRIFGRFIDKDTLILTNFSPRSVPIPGVDKKPLKDHRKSYEWELAIIECMDQWASMFPAIKPMHKDDASDYITNAVSLRDS
jgi:hypothetical protein